MMSTVQTRRAKRSEEGYILVSVMFMLALLIIAMAVAMPKISADIQRDRELETFHRGMQYRRAIQLDYKKFNQYPPNIDALVKTNNIRFLRKRYIDPITGKDDWKPIMFGQNKAPLAMGFFGQPLGGAGFGGAVLAGTGPGGSNTPISTPIASTGFGSGAGGLGQNANPTDPNAGIGQNAGQNPGTNPTDPGAGAGQIAGSSPIGGSGPTFGGAGIVGFSPASPKQSILVYKKKNHYNEWEFTYSPISEMSMMGGMQGQQPTLLGGGQGAVGPGTNPGGFGPSTGGLGPTPTPTPTPTPAPQQPAPQQQ
jgi:type II secretory pathway pseudopilin PulG